jgi:aryl-alcohol dehydrogenase-like predicted oxidoreductase
MVSLIHTNPIPLCSVESRELGIGIVPYSPIGRGFFGGRGVTQQVSSESSLVQTQNILYQSFNLHNAIWHFVFQFTVLRNLTLVSSAKASKVYTR